MQSVLGFFIAVQDEIKKILFYLRKSSILLVSIVFCLLILEMSIPDLFNTIAKENYDSRNLYHVFFYMGCTFLFLLALPFLVNRFFYREDLKELGWQVPSNKLETCFWVFLSLLILVPTFVYVAKLNTFQSYYSLHRPALSKLLFIIIVILPSYYFCEEFFFRGFLFLNLWRRVRWHSFWITDILFTFGHLGKPWLEVLLSLPVGTVLAWLVLRSKSLYPAMLVHYVLGVTMLLAVNQVI